MKRSRSDIERLIAELESDSADLKLVADENARAWERIVHGADDQLDWAAVGYTIHNVYGVMESYCLRVAKFFENSLDPATWHRDLLHRMTLEVHSVRPALLSRDSFLLIDELRSFRHVFRNLYARPLDPERTSLVQKKVSPATEVFLGAHVAFLEKLTVLASALEHQN